MEENELEKLRQEVSRLEARIVKLEAQLGLQVQKPVPAGPTRTTLAGEENLAARPDAGQKPDVKEKQAGRPWKYAHLFKGIENWEEKVGGTWLNRLGIIALLIGIGLGLKFAFDKNLISNLGRVILGCLAGAALLGAGFWYRRRFPKFAAGLSGGGIGAFYLTVYAAFKFYALIDNVAAFALMIIITAGAVALSLLYDSSVIASLGLLGGYLTPILIGGGNYLELLIYLIILNLGAAVLLSLKRWTWLSVLSLGFTWVLVGIWISKFLIKTNLLSFMLFLSAYNLIFSILGLIHNIIHRRRSDLPLTGVMFFSNLIYGIFAANLLLKEHALWLMVVFIGWGVFYLANMLVVNRWRRQDKGLALLLLFLSLAFLTVAAPVALSQAWVTIVWAIWAVVLSTAGARLGHLRLRQFGLLVMALAFFRLLFIDVAPDIPSFHYFWPTLVWLLGGGVLLSRGARPDQRKLRQYGWLFLAVGTLRLFLNDLDFFHLSRLSSEGGERFAFSWFDRLPAIVVVSAALFIMAWIYNSRRFSLTALERKLSPWLVVAANLGLVVCVVDEIDTYFYWNYLRSLPSTINIEFRREQYEVASNTASSIFMALYGFLLVAIGFWKKGETIIRWCGLILLLITLGKIIFIDLSAVATIWRIVVFLATGLVLLIVSYLYQRFNKRAQRGESRE